MIFGFAYCNSYLSYSRLYRRMKYVVFFLKERKNVIFCSQVKKKTKQSHKSIFRFKSLWCMRPWCWLD